jgi:hypothetical protein
MTSSDPFRSEQVGDAEFEAHVEAVIARPGMFVPPPFTIELVCAYILGYDTARSKGPLIGFQEWLVVHHAGQNVRHWTGNVRDALPKTDDERERMDGLGSLFMDFFRFRREQGITKIYYEYAELLLAQSYYEGPLRRGPETA